MTVILEELLAAAVKAGASDLHITVGSQPRIRVNGVLTALSYPRFMPEDTLGILISIMTEAQRGRFEAQGECDCSFTAGDLGRFRVSAYRQRGYVALAFRPAGSHIPEPEELGIPDCVMELCGRETGLILVTGQSGSGKSAVLAALLDRINSTREAHIITLERPIEYIHEHKRSIVEQREIGEDSESYSAALEAALREDPDVIFVSELPDPKTIDKAVMAAETGHLVLASMYTQGTAETIERLSYLFPDYRQQQIRIRLANVLEAVISRQLLPNEERQSRVAAYEILQASKEVRALIREGKTGQIPAVMEKSQDAGMVTMDDAVETLFKEGKIPRETMMWYARRKHYI